LWKGSHELFFDFDPKMSVFDVVSRVILQNYGKDIGLNEILTYVFWVNPLASLQNIGVS
jgi:hypothetical protein